MADEQFADSFGLSPELCRSGLPLDQATASIHEDDQPRVAEQIQAALAQRLYA